MRSPLKIVTFLCSPLLAAADCTEHRVGSCLQGVYEEDQTSLVQVNQPTRRRVKKMEHPDGALEEQIEKSNEAQKRIMQIRKAKKQGDKAVKSISHEAGKVEEVVEVEQIKSWGTGSGSKAAAEVVDVQKKFAAEDVAQLKVEKDKLAVKADKAAPAASKLGLASSSAAPKAPSKPVSKAAASKAVAKAEKQEEADEEAASKEEPSISKADTAAISAAADAATAASNAATAASDSYMKAQTASKAAAAKAPATSLKAGPAKLKNGTYRAQCFEGDDLYKFETDRNCATFTDKEWAQPFSKWPYLTRWCKMFNSHGEGMHRDGCMAQECIANKNSVAASDKWWTFMQEYESPENRASEAKYCWSKGFCDKDMGLDENSTQADMEKYCDKRAPKEKMNWRELTPYDWVMWMKNGFGEDMVIPVTCAWGTLHCDATRCQKYLCTPEWKKVIDTYGAKIRPFLIQTKHEVQTSNHLST